MSALELSSSARAFDGEVRNYRHASEVTSCDMEFSVFLPERALGGERLPVFLWLSGLTCTPENFTTKAGAQRLAAEHDLVVVAPDTSPRGESVPDVSERWDLGQGAGFYVDATQAPWRDHYRMYSYVTSELPELLTEHLPVDGDRFGISGHSMGGHGALVCALRNPGMYRSVSAFAPIVTPSNVQWGRDAFTTYLGTEESEWAKWDANRLVEDGMTAPALLIDQGTDDGFLPEQLEPAVFASACAVQGQSCTLRMQQGYDHSYWFVSTFLPDHMRRHAKALHG